MRIVSWNVNSITARLPRVLELLAEHRPDIACLQETKVGPDAFPHAALREVGYEAADHSGGRWAGVAVLYPAGTPVEDVRTGLPGDPLPDEARWIEATVDGVRAISVYVPNGRAVGTEPYAHKLAFLAAARERLAARPPGPLVLAGDTNVAPTDLDVWDPSAFVGSTHVTPEERGALRAIVDTGLVDAYRALHPQEGEWAHTWWDYRAGCYHKRQGMRIDLALLSPDLAARLTACRVDRAYRKGSKPSDHAPLLVDLD